jgi:hypothetical protein
VALCAGFDAMSAAKRALRRAIQTWFEGRGPAPQLLRICDACGEERWRPLERRHAHVAIDAHLADGRRADVTLRDAAGRVRLIVRLEGGSRLPNRVKVEDGIAARLDVPVIVLSGPALVADPLRWRPLRERGLPRWRCRCALARPLPVDDAFSLRVLGCPINGRRQDGPAAGGATASTSVIHDCARCAFFVGIGYADAQRRRISLYCAFGAGTRPRIGPASAPRARAPLPLAAGEVPSA